VTGGVCVDVLAVEFDRAERQDAGTGGSHVLDHDVEMELLRYGRVWPGGRLMAGRELECQPGRLLAAGDHDPVVTAVGDGQSQQLGVERGERGGVGTIENYMMQTSDHDHMMPAVSASGRQMTGRA
jgi:hypothetical protein